MLSADNVDELLINSLRHVERNGNNEESRWGPARTGWPLLTELQNPRQRVVLNPVRRWPPWLYLMEGLYVFISHNRTELMARYSKEYQRYDQDGAIAADYGERFTSWFKYDQLDSVVTRLKDAPHDRRYYLALWDPSHDSYIFQHPIVPCNVGIQFRYLCGLNCYVFNRSNDLLWGMFGANSMQFSMLLEVIAYSTGLKLGRLYQYTTTPHYYTDGRPGELVKALLANGPMSRTAGAPIPIELDLYEMQDGMNRIVTMLETDSPLSFVRQRWLNDVALPVLRCHRAYREKQWREYLRQAAHCACPQWQSALILYLEGCL